MGTPGSIYLRRGGVVELFRDSWSGRSVPWLMRGPGGYEAAVRAMIAADADAPCTDDRFCDGAVLVDHDARELLLFLNSDGFEDVPIRRRFVERVRSLWPGWTVCGAPRGMMEIMEALGRDLPLPEAPAGGFSVDPVKWLAVDDEVSAIGVVTVRSNGRDVHVPVNDSPVCCDLNPGNLEAWLRTCGDAAADRLVLGAFPRGGAFIDVDAKTAAFWAADPFVGVELRERWTGWRVVWWGDRYESHLEAAGETLRFPVLSEAGVEAAIEWVLGLELRAGTVARWPAESAPTDWSWLVG